MNQEQEPKQTNPTPEPPRQPAETPQPVVNTPAVPKVSMSQETAVKLSAVSLVFAAFFAVMTIFAAIASFTGGKWAFSIPFISFFAVGSVSTMLIAGLTSALFAAISFKTVRKITDTDLLKSTYKKWTLFLGVISVFFVSAIVATILYSLFMLGNKLFSQSALWLNGFLPALVTTSVVVVLTVIFNAISKGKTAILGALNTIVLIAASLALILSIVSILVNTYSDKTPSIKPSTSCTSIYDINCYF
jgi:MFS family permease